MLTNHHDMLLLSCHSYSAYLDRFVPLEDIRYFRNHRVAQHLVSLNYRTSSDIYSRETFNLRKKRLKDKLFPMFSGGTSFSDSFQPVDPVIRNIAEREKPNMQKTLSTIIFITASARTGSDVSSYMDLEESIRLSAENNHGKYWTEIFAERRKLLPRKSHLSFFDFSKGKVYHNNSNNYLVVHDVNNGLTFMHRGDHKQIIVDEKRSPNFIRTVVYSPIYGFVKFYDHAIRRKV